MCKPAPEHPKVMSLKNSGVRANCLEPMGHRSDGTVEGMYSATRFGQPPKQPISAKLHWSHHQENQRPGKSNDPSWGAPAPQIPWLSWVTPPPHALDLAPPAPTGNPEWGEDGRKPPPRPYWRRRRQVRGFWGAGAPQKGRVSQFMLRAHRGGPFS